MVRRRLLPTAIVGGAMVSGMVFGGGTAVAQSAPTCSGQEIVGIAFLTSTPDGVCAARKNYSPLGVVAGRPLTAAQIQQALKVGLLRAPKPVATTTPGSPTTTTAPAAPSSTTSRPPATTTPAAAVAPVVPPPAVAPPPVLAAGAAPRAALLDPGYSPALLARGTYDPALLLGAPGVTPMLGLASSTDPASAVTTASQVQAMALQAPGGLGFPAVAGVIILAGLGGAAVRHRLRRAGGTVPTSS